MTVIVIASRRTATANAEPAVTGDRASFFSLDESRKLRQELESARGDLTLARAQFERANKVIQYSTKYGVTAGMAGKKSLSKIELCGHNVCNHPCGECVFGRRF